MWAEYRRLYQSVLMLAIIGVTIAAGSVYFLYHTALGEEKKRLIEVVRIQTRIIESMYAAKTDSWDLLKFVNKAHELYELENLESEFSLGMVSNNSIVFLIGTDLNFPNQSRLVPGKGELGTPMQQALTGFSGTMIGRNYAGVKVLAACDRVPQLHWGVVANLDLREIRKPFIRAGGILGVATILLILLGSFGYYRAINPIIISLKNRTQDLEERVKELNCLYKVTSLHSERRRNLDEIIQGTADVIPSGLQYPNRCNIRITFADTSVTSRNFKSSSQKISSPIYEQEKRVGEIEVFYSQSDDQHVSFLQEEEELVEGIAGQLSKTLSEWHYYEALRESEKRYHNLFDNVPVGLYQTTPDGDFLDANSALVKVMRYPDRESLLQEKVTWVYTRKEDREEWQRLLEKQGVVEGHETQVRRKDGSLCWIRHSTRVVNKARSKDILYEGAIEDITEQKKAADRIRQSEERFRTLVQNSTDIISVLDQNGIIQYESIPIRRVLGYTPEELHGKQAFDFIHPGDIEKANNGLKEVLNRQGKTLSLKLRMRHKDGSWRYMETTATNLLHKPSIQGIVANSRDITESVRTDKALKEYAGELERSNKELEQFAYVASHDLQEPLRMVSSYLQLLQKRYDGQLDSNADEFIEYAVDGAVRMKTLINDLLQYSRVTTRGKPFEEVDLNRVTTEVLKNLEVVIDESGAILHIPNLPVIQADTSQIKQVFQNLIHNSIRYHGKQPPEIEVTCQAQDNQWQCSVKDNGIGIAPEYHDRVFEIFEQLHGGQKGVEGTGIGLSLVKRIIERHQGQIWIDSAEGEGTTVFFTIQKKRLNS